MTCKNTTNGSTTIKTICPKCYKYIEGKVRRINGSMYIEKSCDKHGKFKILLAEDAQFYAKFISLYRNYVDKERCTRFSLTVNTDCNLDCPICFVNTHKLKQDDPTIKEIKNRLNQISGSDIVITGGEPTLRKDLPAIIKTIRKSGNNPLLLTNGLLFENPKEIKKLKKAGLKCVCLSFDGFDDDVYMKLRKKKLAQRKINILNNLKDAQIHTILEFAVVRGVSEKEIIPTYKYALKHDHIRGIGFRSYCTLGTINYGPEYSMSSFDIVSKYFNKDDILDFQALSYMFGQKDCTYMMHNVIVRETGSLVDALGIKGIRDNPAIIVKATLSPYAYELALKYFQSNFSFDYSVSSKYLILSFQTACDPYFYDGTNNKCTRSDIIETTLKNNLNRERSLNH